MNPTLPLVSLSLGNTTCRLRSVVLADGSVSYEFALPQGPWQPLPANVELLQPGLASLLLPDGQSLLARLDTAPTGQSVVLNGQRYPFAPQDPRSLAQRRSSLDAHSGPTTLTSPMPGRIVRILLPAGSPVAAKQGVLMVEAMKMQNELKSPKAGTVESVLVAEGDSVAAGQPLAIIR